MPDPPVKVEAPDPGLVLRLSQYKYSRYRVGISRQTTSQAITWDMALNSQEYLTPPAYDWNVTLTVRPVAMPGVTKFV
jgi:hypothetical protein